MARNNKIKPSDVAGQFDWDIGALTDFCADALEDANDHNIAYALRAMNVEAYDLAKEFIQLEADQAAAGELTPEIRERREALLEQLDEAQDAFGDDDEESEEREGHVCDDDCRSYGCSLRRKSSRSDE